MRFCKLFLLVSGAVCLLAIGAAALWCAWAVSGMRSDLRATQDDLVTTVELVRSDVAKTQAELLGEVAKANKTAGVSFAQALQQVKAARVDLRGQLAAVNATAAGLRADVGPVLNAATAAVVPYGSLGAAATRLAVNASDSWDDLYDDTRAAVQSATVAGRGVAEASEAVGKAMPAITQAAERNVPGMLDDGKQITKNVRRATSLPMVILKFAWEKTLGRLF